MATKTKVFEFISTEHTAKNLMIVGTKGKKNEEAVEAGGDDQKGLWN